MSKTRTRMRTRSQAHAHPLACTPAHPHERERKGGREEQRETDPLGRIWKEILFIGFQRSDIYYQDPN